MKDEEPMEDSVSFWIEHLKQGNADAAGRLWDAYFQRLIGLARFRIGSFSRRMADEEDVALSVFDSEIDRSQQSLVAPGRDHIPQGV